MVRFYILTTITLYIPLISSALPHLRFFLYLYPKRSEHSNSLPCPSLFKSSAFFKSSCNSLLNPSAVRSLAYFPKRSEIEMFNALQILGSNSISGALFLISHPETVLLFFPVASDISFCVTPLNCLYLAMFSKISIFFSFFLKKKLKKSIKKY